MSSTGLIINGCKIIPNQFKNSFIMLNDRSIASVQSIDEAGLIKICKIKKKKRIPAFNYPTSSALLDIYMISTTARDFENCCTIHINDILRKCMILPFDKKYIVYPML